MSEGRADRILSDGSPAGFVHLQAVCGILLISLSAIWVRLSGVAPDTSAFFRGAYAVPVLLLLNRAIGNATRSPKQRAIAFASGLMLGLDLPLWHRAIDLIGAGLSTVLGNTQVIFVGLSAWFVFGERPRRAVLATLPLVGVGIVLVSGLGRSDAYGADPLTGTIFGVATAILYSGFLLGFRVATRSERLPVGALLDATVGATLASGLMGWSWGGLELAVHWPAHGWLVGLALGSQVAGWLLIAVAIPRLPSLETSFLLLLQPVCTVLWAMIIFGERLSDLQWAGAALVLSGIGLASIRRRPAMTRAPPGDSGI